MTGTETLARPNRYPANCVRCGARIPAGEGLLARTPTGWAADHPEQCPDKPMGIATPVKRVEQDGIYRRPTDDAIFKVQIAVHGSGQLYAKRLAVTECHGCKHCCDGTRADGGQCHRARFEYAPGEIHTLQAGWRLSEDDARTFGRLYGVCCACGATLTDENSIAAGIGPICGGKYFE